MSGCPLPPRLPRVRRSFSEGGKPDITSDSAVIVFHPLVRVNAIARSA
jgi:hypothetical protein